MRGWTPQTARRCASACCRCAPTSIGCSGAWSRLIPTQPTARFRSGSSREGTRGLPPRSRRMMDGLTVVRAIHFASAIQVIGALLFVLILRGAGAAGDACEGTNSRWLMRLALVSVVAALLSGLAWFTLQIAAMTGSIAEASADGAAETVLFETQA